MPFVLDASIVASWAFPDETHPQSEAALASIHTNEAVVPAIWWFEIRNTLVVGERRKRITERDTTCVLRNLARLPIEIDRHPDESGVLYLARKYRLSVYDAAYLELARRQGLPLATLDSELSRAARAESVRLIGEK